MTSAYRSSTPTPSVWIVLHRLLAHLGRGGYRDYLLGEHVERVARHDGGLDRAFAHAPANDRALEQVAAELGEDAPLADIADAVAGTPDALQAPCHGLGRLDLQHQIDRPHVDPKLKR